MRLTDKQKNILSAFLMLAIVAIVYVATNSLFPLIGGGMLAFIPLADLVHDENNCNMAGISTIVYVARVQDITKWPELPQNQVLPEHTVDLVGDFELAAGRYWHTFYTTQEMGELKSEVQGNRDAEYFQITGSFFYPNTNKRALGLANMFKSADVIIIIKEFSGTGQGQMRVIGTKDLPARIKPAENSGKAFSDQKGITFNFEAASCSVAYVYSGVILTEAGEVQTPVILSAGQNILDGSQGSRFVFNRTQTADATLTEYTNCEAGGVYRIENTSAYSYTIMLGYGGSITISNGEYVDLFFHEDNVPIVINTNVEISSQ